MKKSIIFFTRVGKKYNGIKNKENIYLFVKYPLTNFVEYHTCKRLTTIFRKNLLLNGKIKLKSPEQLLKLEIH